jgi:hypothetical protein
MMYLRYEWVCETTFIMGYISLFKYHYFSDRFLGSGIDPQESGEKGGLFGRFLGKTTGILENNVED